LRMTRRDFDNRVNIGHVFFVKLFPCGGARIHDNEFMHDNAVMRDVHSDLFPGGDCEVVGCEREIGHLDIDLA